MDNERIPSQACGGEEIDIPGLFSLLADLAELLDCLPECLA